jgi:hypothetical protein
MALSDWFMDYFMVVFQQQSLSAAYSVKWKECHEYWESKDLEGGISGLFEGVNDGISIKGLIKATKICYNN